ncbi:unnamed protein product, partial [Urochloa humidicola]
GGAKQRRPAAARGGAGVKQRAATPRSSQRLPPRGGGAELQLPLRAARGETSRASASLNQSSHAPNRSSRPLGFLASPAGLSGQIDPASVGQASGKLEDGRRSKPRGAELERLRAPAGGVNPSRRALHDGAPHHAGLLSPLSDGGGRLGVARAPFPEAGCGVPQRQRPLAQQRSQATYSVRSGPAASFSGAAPASACLGARRVAPAAAELPRRARLAESKPTRPGEEATAAVSTRVSGADASSFLLAGNDSGPPSSFAPFPLRARPREANPTPCLQAGPDPTTAHRPPWLAAFFN